MSPRLVIALVFTGLGAGVLATGGVAVWVARDLAGPDMDARALFDLYLFAGAGVGALLAALVIAWWILESRLAGPLFRLAREVETVTHSPPESDAPARLSDAPAPIAGAVAQLASRYMALHRDTDRIAAAARARVEEQKSRLEAILLDLTEGVVVCNLDHRVLLYNRAALRILNEPETLGLGRPLFQLVTREPILHTLENLERLHRAKSRTDPDRRSAAFVCATADARLMLRGRMSLVLNADGRVTGYVLSFADASTEIAEAARRDALLRQATDGLRGPVANLRAAAETLADNAVHDPGKRRAFEQVLLKESRELSDRLEALSAQYRDLAADRWPISDIYSADLINCTARRVKERSGIDVTQTGIPLWLRGESYSLMLALAFLIERVAAETGVPRFDAEALMGDRRVYLEVRWHGPPVAAGRLDAWLETRLEAAQDNATVREILDRHGSEPWCREETGGTASLRIPLPAPLRIQFEPAPDALPPRPEFYDFDLMHQTDATAEILKRPLASLDYVVFDTETTGLRPSEGDEIVSIGAVRIVNRRILTGETFSRLVNPGRPIPKASMRFHGISDEMVADKPSIAVVLPQFKAFVGEAVMVAHNAAFDMKFLRLKETECGVSFDNPVLDTLLLSAFLHDHEGGHTLDAIAARFGIAVYDRHTALGDAMITAAIFIRLIDLLEGRGIRTLAKATEVSNSMVEIRRRQARF